jgi:uncharacterized protein YggE
VLHLAITSGANNSGGIEWQLEHDDTLQAEAAKKALEHARQIATKMAEGLGTKLGALVYASNQTPPRGIFAGMGFGSVELNTESAMVERRTQQGQPQAPRHHPRAHHQVRHRLRRLQHRVGRGLR